MTRVDCAEQSTNGVIRSQFLRHGLLADKHEVRVGRAIHGDLLSWDECITM